MAKAEKDNKAIKKRIRDISDSIEAKLTQYRELKGGCVCYPFLDVEITRTVVDDIFDDLRTKYKECDGHLNVIVDSGGGDIDAAYNLAMLFRKIGQRS